MTPVREVLVLGIVTGLMSEARIACGLGPIRVGGGTPAGARRAALALVDAGATALVSFGYAGGLDPSLRAGDLIVPAAVVCGGRTYLCDPLAAEQLGSYPGRILTAESHIVRTVADKAALRARTGADAVDLESGAVAEVAAEVGMPFAVLRAVIDPADRTLPWTALEATDADGAISPRRIARSLLRRPGDVAGLIQLARDEAAARAALIRRVGEIVFVDPELA